MKFTLRMAISYAIDYAITAGFVSLFTFCANVFYLDEATYNQAVFMLICALIMVIGLTTYIPGKYDGQTIGQKLTKIKIVNKNGKPRTYFQCFLRECVLKISCAPIFTVFCVFYYIVSVIIHRTWTIVLPHNLLLKTEVLDLKQQG